MTEQSSVPAAVGDAEGEVRSWTTSLACSLVARQTVTCEGDIGARLAYMLPPADSNDPGHKYRGPPPPLTLGGQWQGPAVPENCLNADTAKAPERT